MNTPKLDLTRHNDRTVRRRIAEVTAAEVSRQTGFSESTLSRWQSDRLEQDAKILDALGLAIVPRFEVEHSYLLREQINGQG